MEFFANIALNILSCYRPSVDPTQPSSMDPKWNDPSYDYLRDTYSSHVITIFWKLHGWVDDRIEDWKAANGITGPIQWKGTWVGKMPHHPDVGSLHAMLTMNEDDFRGLDHMDNMSHALAVVLRANKFYEFYMD
jgi:hypothetical protein